MEEIITVKGKKVEDVIIDVSTGLVYTREEYKELLRALLDK